MSNVRYYEIRRTSETVGRALGPFAAPTPEDAAIRAERCVGAASGLRWASWELVDFETHTVVARSSAGAVGYVVVATTTKI